jgi:hypothetical protein
MTKDQASDLRSLIDRVKVCTVEYERARVDLSLANSKLERFVYALEQENTEHVEEEHGNRASTSRTR